MDSKSLNTAQNGVQRFKRTDDKCVSVWDIRMIHRFNNDCAREDDVRLALKDGLVLSPDGRFLAACLKNQERNPDSLQIWDAAIWERLGMRSLFSEKSLQPYMVSRWKFPDIYLFRNNRAVEFEKR